MRRAPEQQDEAPHAKRARVVWCIALFDDGIDLAEALRNNTSVHLNEKAIDLEGKVLGASLPRCEAET